MINGNFNGNFNGNDNGNVNCQLKQLCTMNYELNSHAPAHCLSTAIEMLNSVLSVFVN